MIVHAFISSRLEYHNSWLLTRSSKMTHITPILSPLHWLPIKFGTHFKVLVFTYRALHGQAPVYISDLLHPYFTSRSLRSSDQGLLPVPRARLKTKGDCAFKVVAPTLWNTPPIDIRFAVSVGIFKK